MQKKQLSALPVYDLKQNRFAGLIDVVDISHHLTNSSHHSNAKEFFKTSKVSAVYNPNLKSYFVGITPATPLDTAVLLMSEQRVHRLPVVSAEDPQKLIGLLTQSQILRWIGPNLGEAAKTVVDLGSAPVSLPSTATIKDAINLLHSKRLMGLPIIDGGSVIGDFNLGDLELLGPEQAVFHISSPLSWFLSKFRENTAPYDLTMSNTATLGDVVSALNSNKLHRVYLCKPKTKQVERVVTLTDVLECLYIWDPATTSE